VRTISRNLGEAFVSIRPDTDGFLRATYAKLKAQLSGANIEIPVTLQQARLDASIAAARAKIAALNAKGSNLQIDANVKGAMAKIAQLQGVLADLRLKGSDLQIDADNKAAIAKVLALKVQAAGLEKSLEDMEVGLHADAAEAKLEAIYALIKVMTSDAKDMTLEANTAHVKAQIAAVIAQIGMLREQARNIQPSLELDKLHAQIAVAEGELALLTKAREIKFKVDTSALSRLKNLLATIFTNTPDGGGGGGGGGRGLFAGFYGFGRLLNTTILGVKAWHLALSLSLETLIAVGTAAVAAAVGIAAMAPAAKEVALQMQAIDTVNETLGNQIPGLSRKMDALTKAMAPQVVEAFGGAMNLLGSNFGAIGQTAHQVVGMFDDWIAKLDIWNKTQGGFAGILQAGVRFLGQFGDAIGHVLFALDNLAKADPGTAHVLLDIINGFAQVLEWVSKLPGPILTMALAWHAFYIYGIVAVNLLGKLPGYLGNVGRALAGLSGWQMAGLAALAAIAYEIAKAWGTSSPRVAKAIAQIETSLNNMNAGDALTHIPEKLGELESQLNQIKAAGTGPILDNWSHGFLKMSNIAQESGDKIKVFGNDLSGMFHGNFLSELKSAGNLFVDWIPGINNAKAANEQLKTDIANVTAEINKMLGAGRNLDGEVGNLTKQHFSFTQALTLMNLAGVKWNDSSGLMDQKVKNLIAGFAAMSVQGNLLKNSVDAITFASQLQSTKVSQLNSSWDTFIATVTGGQTGLLGFAQGMQQMTAQMTGSGKSSASLATAQAGVASAQDNLNKLMGKGGSTSLQLTAAQDRLKGAQQRLTGAQDRLNALQSSGTATAAQLATAHGRVSTAAGNVASAQNNLNTVTGKGGASSLQLTAAQDRLKAAQDKLTAAQKGGTASMTGLDAASIQLQQQFQSNVTGANSYLDSLTTMAAAAGLGSKGTDLLQGATKDLISQMLPAAKGSKTLTAELYALAQRGGYTGADSFQELSKWVGKTKNPMQDLQKKTEALTVASAGLTTDVQNLSKVLGTTLTGAMSQAVFLASGGEKGFTNFASAVLTSGGNMKKVQPSADTLISQLMKMTGNTHDAHNQFMAFAMGALHLTKQKADELWNTYEKGLPVTQSVADKNAIARASIHAFGQKSVEVAKKQEANVPLYRKAWGLIFDATAGTVIRIGHNVEAQWDSLRHSTANKFDGIRHDIAHDWDLVYGDTIGKVVAIAKAVPGKFDSLRHGTANKFDGIRHDIAHIWDLVYSDTIGKVVGLAKDVPKDIKRISDWLAGTFGPFVMNFFTKTIPGWWDDAVRLTAQHLVAPIVKSVKRVSDWLAGTFGPFVANFFTKTIPGWWDDAVRLTSQHLVGPIVKTVKRVSDWLAGTFGPFVANFFTKTIPGWWDDAVRLTSQHLVNPVIHTVKKVSDWFSSTFGPFVSNFFTKTIPGWWDSAVRLTQQHFTSPIINTVKKASNWFAGTFGPWVNNFFTNTLPHYFDVAVTNIGKFWVRLGKVLAGPVNWVLVNVIDKLFGAIDDVATFVGIGGKSGPLPRNLKLPGFARGGTVPGGFGGGDRVHALLEPGEAVVDKMTTKKYSGLLGAMGVPGFGRTPSPVGPQIGDAISGTGNSPMNYIPGFAQGTQVTKQMLNFFVSQVGHPYSQRNPGRTEGKPFWDCSGLLYGAAIRSGIPLPRSEALANMEADWFSHYDSDFIVFPPGRSAHNPRTRGSGGGVQEGDLLFMTGSGPGPSSFGGIGHTGMAMNSNTMVSAYDTAEGVGYNPIANLVAAIRLGGVTGSNPLVDLGHFALDLGRGIVASIEDIFSGLGKWSKVAIDLAHGDTGGAGRAMLDGLGKGGAGGAKGQFAEMLLALPGKLIKDVMSFLLNPIQAFASQQQGTGAGASGPAGVGGSAGEMANGRQIYEYLLKNLFGGHKIAAAGATASIWGESLWNPFAINCVPLTYKVVTTRGILAHHEVRVGDRTPTWNPVTGRVEDAVITDIPYHYDAAMCWLGNSTWSVFCTVDHKWITERGLIRADQLHPGEKILLGEDWSESVYFEHVSNQDTFCLTTTTGTWTTIADDDDRPIWTGNSSGRGLIGWTPQSTISNADFKGGMKTQLPAILRFVVNSGDSSVISQMFQAGSVEQAANEWMRGVERAGISDVHGQGVALAKQIAGLQKGGKVGTYDSGGWLPPGVSTAVNNTGQPERVTAGNQLTAGERAILNELCAIKRATQQQGHQFAQGLNGTLARGAGRGYYGG
jgi:hypothetical protein